MFNYYPRFFGVLLGAKMSSLFHRLIDAEKGCPFCNFEPCNFEKCMFFVNFNDKKFDCLILQMYANSMATYANTTYLEYCQKKPDELLLLELSPESLKTRLERIQETIAHLEEAISLPALPSELQLRLKEARAPLDEYRKHVAQALEVVGPRRRKKSANPNQDKTS